MPIIDCQVHCYEHNHPGRPWFRHLHGPDHVTGDETVAEMDKVGVDGAILVSPFNVYRYDASYALEVAARHPSKFALVKPVDPEDPGVAETIEDWAKTKGTVAIRLMMAYGLPEDPANPGIARVLTEAAKHGLAVNLLAWGRLEQAKAMAASHPDTQLVIDHIGLRQPWEPPKPEAPWADLPKVLALAEHRNVAIKISGAGVLAKEPYPFPDIWEPLGRIFDAFGMERCLWGTDWTRATAFLDYRQGVDAFRLTDRLSESDKAMLMGGAATRVYGWAPG